MGRLCRRCGRRDAGPCFGADGIWRGVNLLGFDSVMQPYDNRLRAWERVAKDLPMEKLEAMVQPAGLSDLPQLGADILKGQVKGRVVVDVNA